MRSRRWLTVLVLSVATLAVSTAAPLIKLSTLDAVPIAAWRTLLCGAVYAVFAVARRESLRAAARRGGTRILVASALLAAHFALWISAFDHTSYAAAVLLLVTQPVFGALIGRAVYGDRLDTRTWISLAIAAAGLVLLVRDDLGEPQSLLGDSLAVLGSLAIAVFFVAVKPLRKRVAFAPFMALTYGAAGLMLIPVALARSEPLVGFPSAEWAIVAALVLVPTVVGHACFNWVVPRVRFFTLNLVIVLEPALALLLGAWMLREGASATEIMGGAVLGAAVLVGAARRRSRGHGGDGGGGNGESQEAPGVLAT